MEDNGRELGSNKKENQTLKAKNNQPKGLTIMILRSVGKVRSFKISGRSIFWVVLFFLLYIPASIFVINSFFDLRYEFGKLSKRLNTQEKELSESKNNTLMAKQHVAVLEDYIKNLQERWEQAGEQPEKGNLKDKKINSARDEMLAEKVQEVRAPVVVDTEDVVIQKEGSWMTVDFKLVNLQPGEKALGGYIHIIAESKKSNPPLLWTYPKEKLRNGYPVNFKRGELFIIKRFKPIRGRIDLDPRNSPPSNIKVLVYDQSGVLILEKEHEVSNVS